MEKDKVKFTEQGYPSPVGSESRNAGSDLTSTSDCKLSILSTPSKELLLDVVYIFKLISK